MQPSAPRGGLLPSNVGLPTEVERAPRPRPNLAVPILLAAVALVVGAAVALVLTAGPGRPAARPLATGVPIATPSAAASSSRKPDAINAPVPAINGISCDTLESTQVHIHVHLAIFFDGQEQQVPLGIGIGQPWQVSDSTEGPFVTDGTCFYWIHTHTEDGVIHIEAPTRRAFTLGDFFDVWQQTLTATQVGPALGPVISYVNGARVSGAPPLIPLTQRDQIQLDVGTDVPPYYFEFPPGT
jgi:hypothetical protein